MRHRAPVSTYYIYILPGRPALCSHATKNNHTSLFQYRYKMALSRSHRGWLSYHILAFPEVLSWSIPDSWTHGLLDRPKLPYKSTSLYDTYDGIG